MALTIGDNFSYQGAKPLDARLQYATIAEMKAKADSTLYDGIMAYCKADGKNYQWKSTNPVDDILGKWREFESGGGASDLDDLGDVEITDVADGDVLKYDAETEKWVNGEDVGGAGRAKSEAIAPVFDSTATYAEGDRVTYEDELYVFNTAHTGAWDAADADKTDVDSEMPEKLTAAQMAAIKAAFSGMNQGAPLRMMNYSTDEQVVGTWIDGSKIYQKTFTCTISNGVNVEQDVEIDCTSLNIKQPINISLCHNGDTDNVGVIGYTYPTPTITFMCFFNLYYKKLIVRRRATDSSTAGGGATGFITLSYTKTTDTPV